MRQFVLVLALTSLTAFSCRTYDGPSEGEMDRIMSTFAASERQEFCADYKRLGDPDFYRWLVGIGFDAETARTMAFTAQFRCDYLSSASQSPWKCC